GRSRRRCPERCSFSETTAVAHAASSRPSSLRSWRTGCRESGSSSLPLLHSLKSPPRVIVGSVEEPIPEAPGHLSHQIDRQQFEETVRTLNNLYAEAEKLGGQSYLEGCLACLTAYTIFLCMETHYEKVLKKVSKYIQEQNEKIYAPQGLLLTDPIERGLRVIEITIYEDRGMSSGR
uniref:Golgin subfamily A member 7 n=2 Tax=Euarchontoglires TaxID=314146 RepID=A0A096MQM7_PAPAN